MEASMTPDEIETFLDEHRRVSAENARLLSTRVICPTCSGLAPVQGFQRLIVDPELLPEMPNLRRHKTEPGGLVECLERGPVTDPVYATFGEYREWEWAAQRARSKRYAENRKREEWLDGF